MGAGCLLRTAQWTRTSFSSGVRRVDNPLMIGLVSGLPSGGRVWVRVFVVWVHVYRLDLPGLFIAVPAVVGVVVGGVWWSSV